MSSLKNNTTLNNGTYRILGTLGQGGFGITYLAIQETLSRKVCIKEFFMKEFSSRNESTSSVTLGTGSTQETVNKFREKFIKEARNIAKLNHPNIVRIIDVFEENNTAYYVMEYAEGGSLADKVKTYGKLTEPMAKRYILQIAGALQYVHKQHMNHLDMKPANVMLNSQDEAILIDFGLAKQYDAYTGGQTSTTPVGLSEGYAPIEQYTGAISTFSPETDIYSLGATYYKLLTGETPPNASDVSEFGLNINKLKALGISQTSIDCITKAMEPSRKQRIKDIRIFIEALNGISSAMANHCPPQSGDTILYDGQTTNNSSSDYRSAILLNQSQGNYREAYDLCLQLIHEGKSDQWVQNKINELIPLMKNKRKKDDRKSILWAIIIGIIVAILSVIIGLAQ